MLHTRIPRSGPMVALGLMLTLLSLLSGCDEKVRPSDPEVCAPQCDDRCEGDDGCGGQCDCQPQDECKDRCAAHETCAAGQCVCEPDCDGKACQADGCGGTCACPPELVQNAQGDFVPREQCTDTCKSAGFDCGDVCGEHCGSCPDGVSCAMRQCEVACVPQCDGTRCDDGCGGACDCAEGTVCDNAGSCVPKGECKDTCESTGASCGTVCGGACGTCESGKECSAGMCVAGVSCETCAMRLVLLDKRVADGRLLELTIGLDYQPSDQDERPRLLDLRLVAGMDARLMEVQPGEALLLAHKELYRDPETGAAFRKHGDGSYQLMAYSIGNTDTVGEGRIATLKFSVASSAPVPVQLVRRLESAAPPPADAALQSSSYDQSLVVSP
jgi:hypothetical protein